MNVPGIGVRERNLDVQRADGPMAHVEVGFLPHVDLAARNASEDDGVVRDGERVADQAAGNRRRILVAPEQEDRRRVTPLRVGPGPFLGTLESEERAHRPAG